jgi:glycosyltransferase involved in cell wall biosynthesis
MVASKTEQAAHWASLVSIVLPIYNQADHISQIVQEYETVLMRVTTPHELVLVVNGCRDRSLEVCQAVAAQHDAVRVVFSQKGGWGLAVKLGLQNAEGDLLCYTNTARTSARDLQLLIMYAIANPGTIIKANRRIRDNWRRRLGSLLYNLECRWLFDLAYWDVNGTPKVFPREFDRLLNLTQDDDMIDAEFNAICRREHYPILEVPIISKGRHGGRSTTNFRSASRMYIGAFRLWQKMGSSPIEDEP